MVPICVNFEKICSTPDYSLETVIHKFMHTLYNEGILTITKDTNNRIQMKYKSTTHL